MSDSRHGYNVYGDGGYQGELSMLPLITMMPRTVRALLIAGIVAAWVSAWAALWGCLPREGDPLSGPSPFELGPERTLSGVETTQAEAPDVAWDGEDFLVVWSARQLTGIDLFAIRVGPYGDPVDGRPWPVSSSPGNQRRPSIAWDGASHLVVWEDDRAGPTKIYATLVTPRGDVIDPKGFAVAESRYAQSAPVVAWTGTGFFVVWSEEVGGASGVDLYGALVMP